MRWTSALTALSPDVTPMRDLDHWENGGYFLFRPEIFDELNEDEDLVEDAIVRLVRRGRVMAYQYKGYWSPADTVKERIHLDERYHRSDCPWMIWDPERSGLPARSVDSPRMRSRSRARRRHSFQRSADLRPCFPWHLELPADRAFSVLAIGAHPDDIEIGAGGTLLSLAESRPGMSARYVVLTGTDERHCEARNAGDRFSSRRRSDNRTAPATRRKASRIVGSRQGRLGGCGPVRAIPI